MKLVHSLEGVVHLCLSCICLEEGGGGGDLQMQTPYRGSNANDILVILFGLEEKHRIQSQ
jgi:hypothetical protein